MAAGTTITAQTGSLFGGDELTMTAVDDTNGNKILIDDKTIIVVESSGAAVTATLNSVADLNERTGDITVTLDSGEIGYLYPSRPAAFRQKTGDNAGYALVTFSAGTMTIGAFRYRV